MSGVDTKFLGGPLNNSGTIVHQSGSLQFTVPIQSSLFFGALNNTGLYDVQGDVTLIEQNFNPTALTNTGTIRKSAGSGTAAINVPLTNNGGALDAESGTLAFSSGTYTGGVLSAGINGAASATLQFTGAHTFTGAFTGSGGGAVQLNGSAFTAGAAGADLNLPAGLLQWMDGVMDGGSAGWRNSGSLTVIQGGSKVVMKNRFDNAGSLVISGGSPIDIEGCTTTPMTNLPGAVLDFQGEGSIATVPTCSGSNFLNLGTIRKSAGLVSSIAEQGFNNTGAGVIDVRAGTLALVNSNNTGGVFTVAAGAILDLTGGSLNNPVCGISPTYSGTYTGSGQGAILLAGCTLFIGQSGAQFNFPAGLFVWTGGVIAGPAPG